MRFLFVFLFFAGAVFGRQNYVIYDEDFSPIAGGYDLTTVFEGIMDAEDDMIELSESQQKGYMGAFGRFIDLMAWDIFSGVTTTVQHEVFGHGYRLRSLRDAHVLGYHIGFNGGYTKFEFVPDKTTLGDLALVMAGGLESQFVLADQLKLQLMSRRSIDGRLAPMVIRNQYALLSYAMNPDTFDNPYTTDQSGNDVKIYLEYLNLLFPKDTTTLTNVQKSALVSLLDPITWFSTISTWKYLTDAKPLELPTLTFGDFHMLPGMSTSLTPYGLEFYAQNYMAFKDRPSIGYVRWGYQHYPSFGFGYEAPHIWTIRDLLQLGLIGHFWVQPQFEKTETISEYLLGKSAIQPGFATLRPGVALSLVSAIPIEKTKTVSVYCEVGGKSKGFVPGYDVDQALILRGGFGLRF